MTKCLCCQKESSDGRRPSREHLLPTWLHELVEMSGVQLERFSVHESGMETLIARHGLNNYVSRKVCNECNNGWMSQLEDEVKPLLTCLVSADRTASSLSGQERNTIARWAYKTSFMLLSGQTEIAAPWEKFSRWCATGRLTPGSAVIFALSEPSLPRAFFYSLDEDYFHGRAYGVVNVRVSLCINSFLLVVLIPSDEIERQPGAPVVPNSCVTFELLWPQDRGCAVLPLRPSTNPPKLPREWLRFIVNQVGAGICRRSNPS